MRHRFPGVIERTIEPFQRSEEILPTRLRDRRQLRFQFGQLLLGDRQDVPHGRDNVLWLNEVVSR